LGFSEVVPVPTYLLCHEGVERGVGKAPHILNLGTVDDKQSVYARQRGKSSRRLSEPHSRSGRGGEETICALS
jgi:hypothetical protein